MFIGVGELLTSAEYLVMLWDCQAFHGGFSKVVTKCALVQAPAG